MNKKVAIITGADGGMGKVITKRLLREGYQVIMACRNIPEASFFYHSLTDRYPSCLYLFHLDLASSDSIFHFVNEVENHFTKIDLLLNNAGVLTPSEKNTADNFEITEGTNYLGHYILTQRLYPLMGRGTRIVNMASLTYKWYPLRKEFLRPAESKKYSRFLTYSNSKLALVYFTLDQSEKWEKEGITINCADPGIVSTKIICLGKKTIDKMCDWFFRPVIRTAEKGAETMLYLALSPDVEGETGGYYANKKPKAISKRIREHPQRRWLQEISAKIYTDLERNDSAGIFATK